MTKNRNSGGTTQAMKSKQISVSAILNGDPLPQHTRVRARDIDPEGFTLYAYAAVEVLAQAAKAAGTLDTAAIAKVIHSGRMFATVLGTLTYDAKGDITTPGYAVYVWRRGYEDQLEYGELPTQ